MRHSTFTALAATALLTVAGAAATAPAAEAAPVPFPSIGWQQRNCDFNGDGRDDVLVGAPGATVGGAKGAGYVTVQYSSAGGISTTKRTVIHQNSTGVPGGAEAGDGFGWAVASGDLDNDGYDDAIVGIPGEDLGAFKDAGGATIFWGSPTGLHSAENMWMEDHEQARTGAKFGRNIEAARFFALLSDDPDAYPRDSIAILENDALLLYILGPGDLAATTGKSAQSAGKRGSLILAKERTVIRPQTKDATAAASGYGLRTLSHGNFNEDSWADLAIGGITTGDGGGAGGTDVLHGSANIDDMSSGGVFDGGPTVTAGDFNHDGQDDLAIGDTGTGAASTGGAVDIYLAKGDLSGLDPVRAQHWTQNSTGVPGGGESGDQWGADLSAGDTNGDGLPDLAIGAPGEDVGSVSNAGAVWVLRGAPGGLTATGARSFDQNSAYVPGGAETSDRWGGQVRLTDANNDGLFGLLAAAPGENTNDGVMWVLPATSSGITAKGSWTYDGGTLGAWRTDTMYGAAMDE
ncbi:esterase [Streptomyces polyrhachis]|uniref:Esterase n=1 Tax=Streptomyces polyrhachis TaxID=1282885 RepID=A0ABW2G8J9_9ACTN